MMQAGQDYGVRVIRAFEDKRVGQILFPPGTVRQEWVMRHLVEAVKPPEEKKRPTRAKD